MYQSIEDILEYWFGYFPSEYSGDISKNDMWFKNGTAYDEEIFMKFGEIYHRAIEGDCDEWQEIQRGTGLRDRSRNQHAIAASVPGTA